MFLSHICFVCATLSGDPILHWLCNIDIRTYVTSGVVASHPLCCLADVDSHAGVGGQCRLLLRLRAARQFVLRDLQPPPQPSGGGNSPDVPASLLHHMRSHYSDGPVTKVHAHTHIIHHVHSHATHNSTLNSHFPACCPLQAVGPSPAQHLKPSQRSDNGSDGQSWFREVLQKNAALEPESQSQQAASVCWQPWPGAQHRHSGFLTSFYTHTHTHTEAEGCIPPISRPDRVISLYDPAGKDLIVQKDCGCWDAGFSACHWPCGLFVQDVPLTSYSQSPLLKDYSLC